MSDTVLENRLLAGESVRQGAAGLELLGGRCRCCGDMAFPKTSICHVCLSEDIADVVLPSEGHLYSWTVIHVGADNLRKPFTLGYVDLEGDARVFTRIAGDPEALRIGQAVRLTDIVVGDDGSGAPIRNFAFEPVGGAS